jgi:hypothetical protein
MVTQHSASPRHAPPRRAALRAAAPRIATQRNYERIKPVRKQTSNRTTAVMRAMRPTKLEQQMSFEELSAIVGFTVTSSSGPYHSARRILERDDGMVFKPVPGFGFARATGEVMAETVESMNGQIRRKSKKMIRRADLAIEQNLMPETHNRMTESRNRASIIYSTTAAPMPKSNRTRRGFVPVAEPTNPAENLRLVK